MLSQVEGPAKPVIAKLDSGQRIEPEERVNLAFFLALLFSRVPKFEREIEQVTDSAAKLWMKHIFPTVQSVEAHFAESGEERGYSAQSFFDFIHNEEYQLVGNRNISVTTMLEQAPKIAEALAFMSWDVVHADPRTAFVTTDSPFGLILTDEQKRSNAPILGVGAPEITKAIPLTLRSALLIRGFSPTTTHYRITRESYIFGPDHALVKSVVRRSRVDVAKPATRLTVEHIPHPMNPNRTFTIVRRVLADSPDTPTRIVVESEGE